MKYLIVSSFIFLVFNICIAQTTYPTVDGTIVAAGVAVKHSKEKKLYENIEKYQDYILGVNVSIASEVSILNQLKKKWNTGYEKLDETVQQAEIVSQILVFEKDIRKSIQFVGKVIERSPKVEPYILDEQADIVLELALLLNDYLIAQKEGKTNLLNSADRFKILNIFLKRVKKIKERSLKLARTSRAVEELLELKELEIEHQDIFINTDRIYDEIDLSKIFPETIKGS